MKRSLQAPARAKWISPSWVEEELGDLAFRSLYEPFAGDAKLSIYFKRRGKRVVAGDVLDGHFCYAKALVANNDRHIRPELAQAWCSVIRDKGVATRYGLWVNQHFTPEETIWLGIWSAHLADPALDPAVRALGAVAVAQTMRYWLTMGTQPLPGKPLTPLAAFSHYLQTVNTWVFNNGQVNQAIRGDAYGTASRVEADLLFCYPPTDQGFFDYPEPDMLFECWVKGKPDLVLPGQAGALAGPPTLGLPISNRAVYATALRRFLEKVIHIPIWAIAFNDRYPLSEDEIAALVQAFRPIVHRASFTIPTAESGAAPTEKLLIAR